MLHAFAEFYLLIASWISFRCVSIVLKQGYLNFTTFEKDVPAFDASQHVSHSFSTILPTYPKVDNFVC
jgi:hypothetical protein